MPKDPYLKKFRIRVSGFRNWLWGLLTLGLKFTQISHKVEIVDAKGNVHEIYRKYRAIHFIPFKKFYTFRFNVYVPKNFEPTHITLWRMSPGSSSWVLRNGCNFSVNPRAEAPGWHTLFDTFRWEEVRDKTED